MNSDQADILDLLAGHTDDSTIERLAFECLMTSLTDDRVASLMNVLGWRGDFDCFAIGGTPETSPASASLVARKAAVSYTHLDVYKRQTQAAPASITFCAKVATSERNP